MPNIAQAIESIKAILQTGEYEGEPDDSAALELSIEALKICERFRAIFMKPWSPLLESDEENE